MIAYSHLFNVIVSLALLVAAIAVLTAGRAMLRKPASSAEPDSAHEISSRIRRRQVCPDGIDRHHAQAGDTSDGPRPSFDASTPGHVREPMFIP